MPLPLIPLLVAGATSGGLSLGMDALLNRGQPWTVGRVLTTVGIGAAAGVVGVLLGPKLLMVIAAALVAVGIGLAVKIVSNLLRGEKWNAGLSWAEIGKSALFATAIAALVWAVFKVVPALRFNKPSSETVATPSGVAPEVSVPRPLGEPVAKLTPASTAASNGAAGTGVNGAAAAERALANAARPGAPSNTRGAIGALDREAPVATNGTPAAATAPVVAPRVQLVQSLRAQAARIEENAWNLQRSSGGRGPNNYSPHMSDLAKDVKALEQYFAKVEAYAEAAKKAGVSKAQFLAETEKDIRHLAPLGVEEWSFRRILGEMFDAAPGTKPFYTPRDASARAWFRSNAEMQRKPGGLSWSNDISEIDATLRRGIERVGLNPWDAKSSALWELSMAIRTAAKDGAKPGWFAQAVAKAGPLFSKPGLDQRVLPLIEEYAVALAPDGLPPP